MTTWLRQSTAVTVVLGPFVDDTDFKTPETALTVAQADIRLSKNGGAFAQTGNAAGATHLEGGDYGVPLNTTDTGTLGTLRVRIAESGALVAWRDFMIVPANVWDSFFGATNLQVDVIKWLGTAAATPTVPGVPEVDITHRLGAAATAFPANFADLSISASTGLVNITQTAADKVWLTATRTVSTISATIANLLADHVWRRTYSNVRTSANGDALAFRSGLGVMGKLVNKVAVVGSDLVIYQEDDTTSAAPGGTQAITATVGANPITALDTA
jgi:hypothetical protein